MHYTIMPGFVRLDGHVCTGTHTFACFTPTRYMKKGNARHARAYITVTTITRFAQNSTVMRYYACIIWLYHACSYTTVLSPTLLAQQWCTYAH